MSRIWTAKGGKHRLESTPGREVHVQSLWGSPELVLFKALRASQCGWRGGGHAESGSKGGQLPLMGTGCWLSWGSPERTPMPPSSGCWQNSEVQCEPC